MAKSMGMGKFRPPTSPKPLNRFWWNSNLRTTIWRPPTIQNKFHFDRTTWVVSANTQFATVGFLSLSFFLFWSLRHAHRSHRWTDFDDLYVIWHLSAQGCAFRWYASPFTGVKSPQKNNFWGVNRRFPAKLLKSKNMHIIKITASISTKFCTAINTTKFSSWVVQKCS